MNELIIKKSQVAEIVFDKETALQDAREIMNKYVGLEFCEEDLPLAKKELANLRKVAKEINAQALKIDKELTNPVKVFRKDVKDVIAVFNQGIAQIDEQVKTFENKQKELRKQEIENMEEYKLISEYVAFDDNWLLKKWNGRLAELFTSHKEQLDTYIGTIKMTCKTLGLESDFYVEKLKTMPYPQVIELMNTVSQAKTKDDVQPVVVDETEERLRITRTITGTKTQLKALKKYALEIGCKYES